MKTLKELNGKVWYRDWKSFSERILKGIEMKQNKIFFVLMIILVLIVAIGCSGKKTEMSEKELSIYKQEVKEKNIKHVKSKIDLLCLKYDVDSNNLKNDLLKYLYPDYSTLPKDENKEIDKIIHDTLYGYVIDTEELISMSKKHNIPISKISGIVYDYKIWVIMEDIEDELPSE